MHLTKPQLTQKPQRKLQISPASLILYCLSVTLLLSALFSKNTDIASSSELFGDSLVVVKQTSSELTGPATKQEGERLTWFPLQRSSVTQANDSSYSSSIPEEPHYP